MARPMAATDRAASAATERLSTGRRVVRASDDAAGLAIAEGLLARHSGLGAAERNVRDGMSAIATADGALAELHAQLQRVRELAVQWANGALGATDRAAIEIEAAEFGAEAARTYEQTAFNGLALLQGSAMALQVGARDADTLVAALPDLVTLLEEDPFTLGGSGGSSGSTGSTGTTGGGTTTSTPGGKATGYWKKHTPGTPPGAPTTPPAPPVTTGMGAIERVDWAIGEVTRHRSSLGAVHSRLEHRLGALGAEREQLAGAESRIRDADIAVEVMTLTRASILRSAQSALLAQAQRADRQRTLALLP